MKKELVEDFAIFVLGFAVGMVVVMALIKLGVNVI